MIASKEAGEGFKMEKLLCEDECRFSRPGDACVVFRFGHQTQILLVLHFHMTLDEFLANF